MKRKNQVRQSVAVSAVLMALLFLLPLAVIVPFRTELFGREQPVDETEGEPFVAGVQDAAVMLRVLDGETVVEMNLGEYLVGVLRAEMPASFEVEALRAQAAAARTYTFYKLQSGGNHGETADICTNPDCCQAYMTEEAARSGWGDDAAQDEKKVESAVCDTDGQAILYGGEPILAVFHAASAGQTRAAGEVWLSDVPYLQPVASPEEGDTIPNYYSRAEFTAEEFRNRVCAVVPEAKLTGSMSGWLREGSRDEAGSVVTLTVGGVEIKGSTLRGALGLRSACFEWEVQGENIVFYVTGYGHGVGLSQYGANRMARDGATWQEILTHYYTGVSVGPWPGADSFTNRGAA